MYFGHIAVGLAAKPAAPQASTGVLLVSATTLDTLSAVFLVTGVERIEADSFLAWSHGLFMAAVWSVLALAVAFLVSRDRRTSLVIGLLVFGHWVLDFISHPMLSTVPDLPLLFDGSPKVGLGLYSTAFSAVAIDFGLLIAAIVFYLVKTRPQDRTGHWALWILIAYSLAMIPGTALPGLWVVLPMFAINLLLPLGTWLDRHRVLAPVGSLSLIADC